MEVRNLKPALKGEHVRDKGGGACAELESPVPVKTDQITESEAPQSQPGVRWRVSRVGRKLDAQRRLVIFRGYARADDGRLKAQQIRAMLDTGAQAEIISPEMVRRLGGTVTEGRFGVAVEAFGNETQLTQQLRGVKLQFPGINPRSLLAQDFTAAWDFIVAPHGLSDRYDMLLGVRFMRRFGLSLNFQKSCSVRLTAADGRETLVMEEEDSGEEEEEEQIEFEAPPDEAASGQAVISAMISARQGVRRTQHGARWMKPLTQSQRRMIRREWRDGEEWRLQRAEDAMKDPSLRDTVMSMEQLEQLWVNSAPGSVKIFAIQAQGFVEASDQSQSGSSASNKPSSKGGVRVGAIDVQRASGCSGSEFLSGESGSLLPPGERAHADRVVAELKREFNDVFPDELPAGVPPSRGAEPFRIDLKEGTKPFGRYGPRMTEENTLAAGKMIKELLDKGFIRPSRSPWGSPMFLVDKPDGGKRMVIDYRGLNASTTRNRYPLPRIDELFDQLRGARYFSKLDLRTGYWQIRVASEDVAKTAFTSRHGHFEWLVLPMGLTNAPAEFMALMENTFREELNKFVLVFLDDILVYSATLKEHELHLRTVLQRLREQKLYAKWSKCTFMRQEVEFLGHFVGRAGVRMVEGKVAAVQRWPTPTTQKEVEQFVGLAGFYRRFIADFSKIAAPLSELCGTLKHSVGPGRSARRAPPQKRFYWGEEQQRAFEALKHAVTSAPCLAIPDPQREFIVHTDSSGYATGAVLMQQFESGLRPIAFLSKKMTPAERRYPVHEQELLAILNALKAWRHYLGGRHFTVLTDHQSLQYVESSAMATPRQMRWAAWLSEFDFNIRYGRGKDNLVADALSRSATGKPESGVAADSESGDVTVGAVQGGMEPRLLVNAINELAPLPVRVREAAQADGAYMTLLAESTAELKRRGMMRVRDLLYLTKAEDCTSESSQGSSGNLNSSSVSESVSSRPTRRSVSWAAEAASDSDPQENENSNRDSEDELQAPAAAEPAEALVSRRVTIGEGQLVVPNDKQLRTWLLSSAHDTLLGGHHSADTTYAWLRERVWWSGMAVAAHKYVRGCDQCQRNKPDVRGKQGLPLSIATPKRAWEVICMDFIGPLPLTARGNDSVMVVIDKLTRWVYYIPMQRTCTSQDVFALLDRYVLANHDTPRQIISDRDSRFTSHFWESIWAGMRAALKRSTSFHPQTDGVTERANRTLIEQLRSHVDGHQSDWDLLLPQLQRANNSSVCVSTGFSPFEMNYGRRVRTELDAELEHDGVAQPAVAAGAYPGAEELAARREAAELLARKRIEAAQKKQRADSQRGRRSPEISAGDKVWLSNRNLKMNEQGRARKLEPLYFGPYDVLEMHGSNAAKLRLPDGCRLHPVFNLDLLRKYVDGTIEFPERPVGDHRPGPVQLEDDSSAGGPGEPEYEVEAIIGSRGRGARMAYRVKWLGWPIEQASWCPAAECRITCPDRVSEYEQRALRRLQAVQIIRGVEVEKREHRALWCTQVDDTSVNQTGAQRGRVSCGIASSDRLMHTGGRNWSNSGEYLASSGRVTDISHTNSNQHDGHVALRVSSLRCISVEDAESLSGAAIEPVTACSLEPRVVGLQKSPTEKISADCGDSGLNTNILKCLEAGQSSNQRMNGIEKAVHLVSESNNSKVNVRERIGGSVAEERAGGVQVHVRPRMDEVGGEVKSDRICKLFSVPIVLTTVRSDCEGATECADEERPWAVEVSSSAAPTASRRHSDGTTHRNPVESFRKHCRDLEHCCARVAASPLSDCVSERSAGGSALGSGWRMGTRGGRGESMGEHSRAQPLRDDAPIVLIDCQHCSRVASSISCPPLLLGQTRWSGTGVVRAAKSKGERTEEGPADTHSAGGTYNTTEHSLGTNMHSMYTQQYECEQWGPLARQMHLVDSMKRDGTALDRSGPSRRVVLCYAALSLCSPVHFAPPLPPLERVGESNSATERADVRLRNLVLTKVTPPKSIF